MPLRSLSLIAFLVFAGFCGAQTSPVPRASPRDTGIEGIISRAPAHPGPERPGIPNSAPWAGVTFSVMGAAGPVADFTTDAQGAFTVSIPAGHYTVTRKGQQKIGHCGPFDVDVVDGQMTKVAWQCDSGMR